MKLQRHHAGNEAVTSQPLILPVLPPFEDSVKLVQCSLQHLSDRCVICVLGQVIGSAE